MATLISIERTSPAVAMRSLVRAEGSAGVAQRNALIDPHVALRDLADAVHALCAIHGTQPGVVDLARDHVGESTARGWLDAAVDGFSAERAYLAALTAAVGPVPSTPGQAETTHALTGLRHAFDMLARSGRQGCAIGAAAAIALDWAAIRPLLDVAAVRTGIEVPRCTLPLTETTQSVLATLATAPAVERALLFGATQALAQHRGLWDLLDARASARRG